jgi:transposase InsO family protein
MLDAGRHSRQSTLRRRERHAGLGLQATCIARYGKPDVFNTDQESQFTGAAFTGALAHDEITISMDGKGAWGDNVFVERLWRSVKYEEVYLQAYDSVSDARASIDHSSIDGMTPDQAYFTQLPIRLCDPAATDDDHHCHPCAIALLLSATPGSGGVAPTNFDLVLRFV